jgi:hypothetical protein
MNDDDHRFGALRESYWFEYAVYQQTDRFKNTHFSFDIYDACEWCMRLAPISPTYPNGDWRRWEVADQRFGDGRPDVLSYSSGPLDHDVTVTGVLSGRRSSLAG